jgi:hypothetical protein
VSRPRTPVGVEIQRAIASASTVAIQQASPFNQFNPFSGLTTPIMLPNLSRAIELCLLRDDRGLVKTALPVALGNSMVFDALAYMPTAEFG